MIIFEFCTVLGDDLISTENCYIPFTTIVLNTGSSKADQISLDQIRSDKHILLYNFTYENSSIHFSFHSLSFFIVPPISIFFVVVFPFNNTLQSY